MNPIKLNPSEVLSVTNLETGEVRIPRVGIKTPNGMEYHRVMDSYKKVSEKAWKLLRTQTTKSELYLVGTMLEMAERGTNSLSPLNDDTSLRELSVILEEDRKTIKKKLTKLHKLGVFGQFSVVDAGEKHTKYWIFNPYLAYNGNYIKEGILQFFKNTTFASIS